jgi:hypothetical protein
MSWDLIRICWPNAAMPFALALMPLIAFAVEWQTNPAQASWVQVQEYEMATVPSPVSFEQPTINFLAAPLGSI